MLWSAKTNVGAISFWSFVDLDELAIRREHADAAAPQRCHAGIAALLERERVKALVARQPMRQLPAIWRGEGLQLQFAGAQHGIGPQTARFGLRCVQGFAVRREADAIRGHEGKSTTPNKTSFGACIVQSAHQQTLRELLAKVGEPEPAMRIEHDVVGSAQRHTVAMRVKRLHFAVSEIYPLNAAPRIVRGLACGPREAVVRTPAEAAVVADIATSIGTYRRASSVT